MKFRIFTFILFVFIFSNSFAQIKFLNEVIILNDKVNSSDIHCFPEVKNYGSGQAEFYWKLTKPEFNSSWLSQVCDLNGICYQWNVDKSNKVNKVPADSIRKMSFQLDPVGVVDSGRVVLNIYSDKDYTILLDSVSIFLNISATSTVKHIRQTETDITIYPNPTSDYFQFNSKSNIGKVEVYSMIGKKIKTYEKSQINYSTKDLRNGIYLIRAYDSKGQIIKVLRMKVDHENP